MFTSNPFAEISGFLSPDFMQAYVVIMVVLVAGGTLYDIIHKKSAKYFFKNWQQQKNSGRDRSVVEKSWPWRYDQPWSTA